MRTKYSYKYSNYRNFMKAKRDLKDRRIKYSEKKRQWAVEYIDRVSDYNGDGFLLGKRDERLVDFFPRIYEITYITKLRILPA